jgi:hypothetical protein
MTYEKPSAKRKIPGYFKLKYFFFEHAEVGDEIKKCFNPRRTEKGSQNKKAASHLNLY